jgi:hypothetical protein
MGSTRAFEIVISSEPDVFYEVVLCLKENMTSSKVTLREI